MCFLRRHRRRWPKTASQWRSHQADPVPRPRIVTSSELQSIWADIHIYNHTPPIFLRLKSTSYILPQPYVPCYPVSRRDIIAFPIFSSYLPPTSHHSPSRWSLSSLRWMPGAGESSLIHLYEMMWLLIYDGTVLWSRSLRSSSSPSWVLYTGFVDLPLRSISLTPSWLAEW